MVRVSGALFTYSLNRTCYINSISIYTHNRCHHQMHKAKRKHKTNQFLRLKSCQVLKGVMTGLKVIAHNCLN